MCSEQERNNRTESQVERQDERRVRISRQHDHLLPLCHPPFSLELVSQPSETLFSLLLRQSPATVSVSDFIGSRLARLRVHI